MQDAKDKIERLLFKQVKKPKGFSETRITNVYDDRYRVNVWTVVEEDSLTKKKIESSYFLHFDGEEIEIKS